MKKIIISAVSLNNVIGLDNRMPWQNKEEIKHFKEATVNNAVLMGRKTFESIGKSLSDRINLVVSRKINMNNEENNLFYFLSIESAIEYAEKLDFEKLFIIGGSDIYLQTVNEVDELLISRIPFEIEGDKHFPKIDENIWELKETQENNTFTVQKYIKV